jgi:hypothetical protein
MNSMKAVEDERIRSLDVVNFSFVYKSLGDVYNII